MLYAALMLYFLTISKGISCPFGNITNHHVDLSKRHLSNIPGNISIHTESLDLSQNEIRIIPNGIFANMRRIVSLDLSYNTINAIYPYAFKGLLIIECLNLRSNNLTRQSLHYGSFQALASLKELDITYNPDYGYSNIAFSDELYRLRLLNTLLLSGINVDQNQLSKFKCFKRLKNLTFTGKGMFVDNTTFKGLQQLPIQELGINIKIADKNAFSFFPCLKKLYLKLVWDGVSFERIFPALEVFKGRRMTAITLTGNAQEDFFKLRQSQLRYLKDVCLKELYLPANFIVDIDASSFSIFARNSPCLEVFDISDNPLSTNNVYWLMELVRFKNLKVIRVSHIGLFPPSETLMQTSNKLTLLLPSTLQEISIHNAFSKRGLPNITAVDGQSMKILSLFQFKLSNCLGSFGGLPNLTELDISGFNCAFLNPDILQSLPRLEKISAQNINLNLGLKFGRESGAYFFGNLFHLFYIDISVNNLESAHSDMFKDQQKTLRYLNLSTNAFKRIPINIDRFKSLEILDLTLNEIEYFNQNEQEMLEKNSNIDIRLSGNPFACTCNNKQFLRWIHERGIKFFANVECIGDDKLRHYISDVISSLYNFELNCVLAFWFYFAVIMSSVCGLVVMMFAIYYRYRSEIQYIFLKFRINMKRYTALQEICEYKFDAFISYSSSDSSWVSQFYRQLKDNGFELCIDAKDFIAGDGIAENIVRAIDCSRRIIFIVTRNFLQSSWGGYEIEMTRMHAFREGRENMVVLIIKDEIPIEEMPRPLKEMWNKIVCIKYYDQNETAFYDSVALSLQ